MSGYELRSIGREERDKLSSRGTVSGANEEQQLPNVVLVSPSSGAHLLTDQEGNPVDKYNIVFIILLIHGIGTLMPWNMFINAEDYFRNYKLKPASHNNGTNMSLPNALNRDIDEDELDNLRKNFLSYLGLAAQIPNALFNGLNLVVNLGSGNLKLRVNTSLAIEAIIFLVTIILAVVNSYEWPGTFFYLTMISVVVLNMASGIYQNCVFGTGAKFPGSYTNAILIGSNLSGTFTSVVNLLSIWLAPEPQTAAMYYFITALLVILVCLISYNMLQLNPFFKHYDTTSAKSGRNELEISLAIKDDNVTGRQDKNANYNNDNTRINNDIPETLRKTVDAMVPRPNEANQEDNSFMGELKRKWQVFKLCWPQCLNVFFTFYITLALFPSVMANIQQLQDRFSTKYFVAFACFLIFNLFAMLGNLLSGWTTWPGRERVWIIVAARILFVPFFLFCNFNPKSRHWPVYIRSDITYMLGNVLLALSSGYLSSLCMMFASSGLKPDEAPKAGMLAAFFLVFGIFLGINSSFFLTWIVELG